MTIPKQIRAGDIIQWRDQPTTDVFGEPINSSDWTVTYYLRTNVAAEGAIVTSSVYQDGWQFSIPAATTADFDIGNWYFQSVADKSGAEKQTIATGQFEVLAALQLLFQACILIGATAHILQQRSKHITEAAEMFFRTKCS